MSSKFLQSSTASDLSTLQNGTFAMNISSANITDLTPGFPVKTDANSKLVSGLIQPSDINGGILGNPLDSDLNIGDFDVVGLPFGQTLKGINSQQNFQTSVIDSVESKTQNITSTAGTTNIDGLVRVPTLTLETLSSTLQTSNIAMSEGGISITSGSLSFNGASVATSADIAGKLNDRGFNNGHDEKWGDDDRGFNNRQSDLNRCFEH